MMGRGFEGEMENWRSEEVEVRVKIGRGDGDSY